MDGDNIQKHWDRVFDINVAVKIIKHISSGIYRTPGGAIKELVNNAFDAQATEVKIYSGYPKYKEFRIEDNGKGMTEQMITRSFELVGSSIKITDPDLFRGEIERPIIGQFGVGLLASAHISRDIIIETYPKNEHYGIEVVIDLEPFFEFEKQIKSFEKFTFGTVKYRKIEKRTNEEGTVIRLINLDPKSDFSKSLRKEGKKGTLVDWSKDEIIKDNGKIMKMFIKAINENNITTIEDLSGRDKMLWEIGLTCPVQYLDDGPVNPDLLNKASMRIINKIKDRIKQLNFNIYFDDVEVRKPILLPTGKRRYTKVDNLDKKQLSEDFHIYELNINEKIEEGGELSAIGYLIYQPYRIFPFELRGLLPRVKYVGIGGYDNSLFKAFRKSESPMLRLMLSGELYVLKGLEDTINLDRASFIEIDEGYQILLNSCAKLIGENIKKEVLKVSRNRQKRRKKIKKRNIQLEMKNELVKSLRIVSRKYKKYTIEFLNWDDLEKDKNLIDYYWVAINDKKHHIYIDENADDVGIIAIILTADNLLSNLSNAMESRRSLSDSLNELLMN